MTKKFDIIKLIKSKRGIAALSIVSAIILIIILIFSLSGSEGTVTYRETAVQYGNLVVGIEESGAVDIGTIQQVFELDMSALVRAGTSTDSSTGSSAGGANMGDMGGGSTAGGMDMFSQIFSMAGDTGTTTASSTTDLVVSEIAVSVGQQVSVGDVLYYLEADSVVELKAQLESDVEKAKADLDAVYADQILSKQTAEYTYSTSSAYGSYASAEYLRTIQEFQEAVATKQKALETAQALLANYEEQLAQTRTDYEEAVVVLNNCIFSRDNTDKWDNPYYYVMYFEMARSAQSTADSLESKLEQLESNVEQAADNVETCINELNAANRNLEAGKLSASQTYELRKLAYSTAQETYNIAIGYLEEEAKEQEETYADAQEKLNEFSSHISNNAVCAKYSGVITSVDLAVGDSIDTNDTLITLYDMDEVTMTVSVAEDDVTDINIDTLANISFTAYPDDVFQGIVTEIADAVTDSSGNVTYDVTITLQGDVSGLFQGMTGTITFITKETQEVLYVSNRAIIREGTKSYVKVKDDNGTIKTQEITTGFSDGVNVEIVEGLEEGDVVLIESKVSE